MKHMLFFLLLIWGTAGAQTMSNLELISDKNQYVVGERPVVIVSVSGSINSTDEFLLEGKINSTEVRLIQITDRYFAAVIPAAQLSGNLTWEVNLYTRNRSLASAKWSEIVQHEDKILDLRRQVNSETDPYKKNDLNTAIQNYQDKILSLKTSLASLKILVETKQLVLPVSSNFTTKLNAPFEILTNKLNDVYPLGYDGYIDFEIKPSLIPDYEEFEFRFDVKLGDNILHLEKISDYTYRADITPLLTLGSHTVEAKLYSRDRIKGLQIDMAIDSAINSIVALEKLRDETVSEYLRSYYQLEMDDLNLIADLLVRRATNLEFLLGSVSKSFSVVDAQLVFTEKDVGPRTVCGIQRSPYLTGGK